MSFDNSRFTFNPWNDYCGVVMEQGRVQLDSDWNEWLAELFRRIQAGTLDTLGRAAYPATTPYAFQITASSSGGKNTISIGSGRMYVDGLLAENHGDPALAQWDPALAELSGAPQPPPASETDTIDYTNQPHFPNPPAISGNGPFLAYLDVWVRPITYLEDPNLVDKAVGVDTTGRLQAVWQVKLMSVPSGTACGSSIPGFPPASSAGLLTTGTVSVGPSGPCCLTANTGYTGMENQFYRVEIHQPGVAGKATFKWSRDNASVETLVTAIVGVHNSVGNSASQLTVQSMGRDQVLGFAPGNWIEILDDDLELNGQPGELHQIDSIDFAGKTITLDSTVSVANFPVDGNNQTTPSRHTRIRRWDQSGKVYESDNKTVWVDLGAAGSTGDIPVPPAGTTLILENGITVSFGVSSPTGAFQTGDFWTFAARTADGSVEQLSQAPPRGVHHHYAPLSIVTFPSSATDCRTKWPPAAGEACGCCCTCTVGDGIHSTGKFSSIQAAINSLPDSGGEVCILAGRYFENVLIQDRRNIVLHGCGWQTRIASRSLQPGGASSPAPAPGGTATPGGAPAGSATGFNAVISITSSQHIELRSFAVEATTDEAGILIDGTGELIPAPSANPVPANNPVRTFHIEGVLDTTIEDTVIAASTLPAILAQQARLLRIEDNRIAMQNVESLWPAVYASGEEIRIERNWIGIQNAANLSEWFPSTVTGDLAADAAQAAKAATAKATTAKNVTGAPATTTSTPPAANVAPISAPIATTATVGAAATAIAVNLGFEHPGGIQIAGPSANVFVIENEIDGGSRNGITLGSLQILDAAGQPTNQPIGVLLVKEDACATTGTLQTPGTNPGQGGGKVVAGGPLIRIQIDRNSIRNMGLCGIGPVGFFNLVEALEVISIEVLNISANSILNTVRRSVAPVGKVDQQVFMFGYAAICVPDVQNLSISDNTITNFGHAAGADVCGIFVLHGEMVEISRNQVVETRDWNQSSTDAQGAANRLRGGIWAALVTPPAFSAASTTFANSTIYEPGLPALRVQQNTVRVPLAESLAAIGFGPFEISNNHFGCGGGIRGAGFQIAQTVLIVNLGVALEVATVNTPSGLFNNSQSAFSTLNQGADFFPSSGAVLFTNNMCQWEAREERQRSFASVVIISLDHLIFANNHCWVDGRAESAILDALLLAGSLQVTSNRFQEGAGFPVLLSGLTVGMMNITSQNISTYCLVAEGNPSMLVNNNNLSVIGSLDKNICDQFTHR